MPATLRNIGGYKEKQREPETGVQLTGKLLSQNTITFLSKKIQLPFL
jgi:hypothetical protein